MMPFGFREPYFETSGDSRVAALLLLFLMLSTIPGLAAGVAGPDPAPEAGTPPPAAPAPDPVPAPVPAPQPVRFYIRKFKVDGVKALNGGVPILTPAEVQEAVYPYMGPYRTAADVDGARAALEKAYQGKGFQTVSVQVPVQAIQDVQQKGVVALQVVQYPVGRLRVEGSRFYSLTDIKEGATSIAPGTVPDFNKVSQDIVALNQLPDRQVTPALRAGTTPGTVDIDLNVKDHFPLHGSTEINNRNSANTSPWRSVTTVSYDNLFLGHSISLSYTVSPDNSKDTSVFSGSYLARIPGMPGLSFLTYGLKSDSNVASVGNINVAGKGQVIGERAIIGLPSEKGFFESVSLGLDYKEFDQGVTLPGTSEDHTPVTYIPLSATYTGTWQGGDGSLTQLNAGATWSLRGIGGSTEVAFNEDRVGASGDFIYLRGDFSRLQPLPKDFQLWGRVQGQISPEPLINSEQIGAGGLDTVRGYFESEQLGDNGILGQFELRSSSIGTFNPSVVDDWRLYVFGDCARLGLNQALAEQQSTFGLASVGLGTRMKLFGHFNGSVDLAMPLLAGPNTEADTWHFTVRAWLAF